MKKNSARQVILDSLPNHRGINTDSDKERRMWEDKNRIHKNRLKVAGDPKIVKVEDEWFYFKDGRPAGPYPSKIEAELAAIEASDMKRKRDNKVN